MQFLNFKEGQFIDFLGFKRLAVIISGILILAGVASIVAHYGLKYGIDFRGGTNVQIQFSTPPNLDQLRYFFAENGMKNVEQNLKMSDYGKELGITQIKTKVCTKPFKENRKLQEMVREF